jgi:molybdate transport system substrate-binding protein
MLLMACGGSADAVGGNGDGTELLVLAAASLTGVFADIGHAFEQENPGVTVTFSFGPSDGLATQIQEGAPADIFASASPRWIDAISEDPGVIGRADFARNRLTVIVPADNPAGIRSLEDLARPGLTLVLAAKGVPAGDYARQILDTAGIAEDALANVVSNEEDVKGVVQKVLVGEADAGIVYVTDLTPEVRSTVQAIPIPDDLNVIATYSIAAVADAGHPDLTQAFLDHVLGEGQETLQAYGFLPAG